MNNSWKISKTIFLLAVLFLSAVFSPLFSRAEFFFDDYGAAKILDIVLGESKVIDVKSPKRIAIGNPEIADVAGASATELLVSGKSAGETNIQIWDDFGQREITVRVFQEDLKKIKDRLEDLFATAGLRGISFRVGDQERKVFVIGELPSRKQAVKEQLLESFVDKIIDLVTFKEENPIVEVDVQVLEISKSVMDKLGMNWSNTLTFQEEVPSSDETHTLNRLVGTALKSFYQSQFTRSQLTATLQALQRDNLVRTLARPKLVALSGKEASILVGGEIPVLSNVSVSSGTTTTSVEYVEYGIKLNISPEVQETGDIICKLEVEVKTVDSSTALSVQTAGAVTTSTPGFKTRNVKSELYLKSDQTIFLAGLIDSQETNNLAAVPALSSVPILGALFRSKEFSVGDSELVISIRPRVIHYAGSGMKGDAFSSSARREGEEPYEAYVRQVQEMILKNVSYPLEAQRANLSGDVVLSLHLLSSGQLIEALVEKSSGHKLLDQAALFTVKRLAPYPQFSKELLLKEIWVEIPIAYQLT